MSIQPPQVLLVKTEPQTVTENEPPESEIMEIVMDEIFNTSDIKDIDIVSHTLSEDSIKSENMFESKYSEYVETQVFVKTENAPLVKIENIIECEKLNKTKDTDNGNGSWDTGRGVIEVEASNEHFKALDNLKNDEQLVHTFSSDLNDISTSSIKAKHAKNIDFARCYNTNETTSWEEEKEKIQIIRAPVISVKPHEYTSLTDNKHVCNHCQHAYKKLNNLKRHIKQMHRKVTTMYQCPYCPFKTKWRSTLQKHIIRKHKDWKDVQWFQCHLCEKKFKLKSHLTEHMKIHLKPKQMQHKLGLHEKRYCCDKCNYKTDKCSSWKTHKLIHLKPEEIQYFYCYHCSYKAKLKSYLTTHIFRHFKNENIPFHCYICDFITLKRESFIGHIKKHSKVHIKFEINEGS